MAITLTPSREEPRLRVSGDIETTLTIPADPSYEFNGEQYLQAYYIAVSDGSLLRACRHEEPHWEVVIEGAGGIEVDPTGRSVTINWGVEWVTLASNTNASAVAQKSLNNLPLFHPELGLVSGIA